MYASQNSLHDNILVAAVGAIVGGMIGFYLGRKNIRYQEFLRASCDFRDAFTPAIIELNPIEDNKDGYTLDTFSFNIAVKYFEKQRLAVQTFSYFLSKRKRKELNKAWKEYVYPNEDKFPGEFNEVGYDYKTANPAQEPEIRDRMRKRIDKIISFGKYK